MTTKTNAYKLLAERAAKIRKANKQGKAITKNNTQEKATKHNTQEKATKPNIQMESRTPSPEEVAKMEAVMKFYNEVRAGEVLALANYHSMMT